MAQFPQLVPSSRKYNLGKKAVKVRSDLSGAEVRFLRSASTTQHRLQMVFDELTEQEASKIIAHYSAVRGSSNAFQIGLAAWANDPAPLNLFWRYTAPPRIEDVTPNTWRLTVSCISVTSETALTTDSLPPSTTTTTVKVTTAPIQPQVLIGANIGVAIPTLRIDSDASLYRTNFQFEGVVEIRVDVPDAELTKTTAFAGRIDIALESDVGADAGRYFTKNGVWYDPGTFIVERATNPGSVTEWDSFPDATTAVSLPANSWSSNPIKTKWLAEGETYQLGTFDGASVTQAAVSEYISDRIPTIWAPPSPSIDELGNSAGITALNEPFGIIYSPLPVARLFESGSAEASWEYEFNTSPPPIWISSPFPAVRKADSAGQLVPAPVATEARDYVGFISSPLPNQWPANSGGQLVPASTAINAAGAVAWSSKPVAAQFTAAASTPLEPASTSTAQTRGKTFWLSQGIAGAFPVFSGSVALSPASTAFNVAGIAQWSSSPLPNVFPADSGGALGNDSQAFNVAGAAVWSSSPLPNVFPAQVAGSLGNDQQTFSVAGHPVWISSPLPNVFPANATVLLAFATAFEAVGAIAWSTGTLRNTFTGQQGVTHTFSVSFESGGATAWAASPLQSAFVSDPSVEMNVTTVNLDVRGAAAPVP